MASGGSTRPAPATTSVAGRGFYLASVTLALGVGLLQWLHVRGGWLTNYGADVFGTAWLYAMFRQGKTVFPRGRVLSAGSTAVLVFIGCAASEFGQRAHVVPGHFDPLDLVAYGVTTMICYLVDRYVAALA